MTDNDRVKIIIDGKEVGNVDINNLKYDPETKSVTISREFPEDSELVKRILESSKCSFSIRSIGVEKMDTIFSKLKDPYHIPPCVEIRSIDTDQISILGLEDLRYFSAYMGELSEAVSIIDDVISLGPKKSPYEVVAEEIETHMMKYGLSFETAYQIVLDKYKNYKTEK